MSRLAPQLPNPALRTAAVAAALLLGGVLPARPDQVFELEDHLAGISVDGGGTVVRPGAPRFELSDLVEVGHLIRCQPKRT